MNYKKLKFINSYSYIFSPRPGTVSENLNLIDKKTSFERLEIIQNELFENQIKKNKSFIRRGSFRYITLGEKKS